MFFCILSTVSVLLICVLVLFSSSVTDGDKIITISSKNTCKQTEKNNHHSLHQQLERYILIKLKYDYNHLSLPFEV